MVACAASLIAAPALADDLDAVDASARPPEHVLFIGNSHTARHGGLDWLVENFALAADQASSFDATAMAVGGVTLAYHWENGALDEIRTGEYDTVVLQGYLRGSPTGTAEPFLDYARRLDEAITASGAQTVFFMTWPGTFNDWSTIEDVVAAHRTISAELDAPVAPAALAFEQARAERPELELLSEDGIHATWEGAYLAAATVYATLFGRSPQDLDFSLGVDAETAAFLQRVAWQSVQAWDVDPGSPG